MSEHGRPLVQRDEARDFYEEFSLAAGQRDWLAPNLRHEQLKLLISDLLGGRRRLQIADVGCGGGVLTDFLGRYGDVVGVDFSTAAVASASRWTRRASFRAGGVEALPRRDYDLITLFDVLEHIPRSERQGFLVELSARLAPHGLIFASTPHPGLIRHRRSTGYTGLQIIDEEVSLHDVLGEAAAAGLQLIQYVAYDIWSGSPEYQALVLTPSTAFGGSARLRSRRLARRRMLVRNPAFQRGRRLVFASRALARGDYRTAVWFMRGRVPKVDS